MSARQRWQEAERKKEDKISFNFFIFSFLSFIFLISLFYQNIRVLMFLIDCYPLRLAAD